MREDLVLLIVKTLRETSGQETKLPKALGAETPLFGREGILDSLALVTLIVAVEQALEDTFGMSISLADEKAMSQQHSPYRTIGTLAEYAQHVLQGAV
jgi:D-alanine--poly(phosphoribitol) ligase subunit 2